MKGDGFPIVYAGMFDDGASSKVPARPFACPKHHHAEYLAQLSELLGASVTVDGALPCMCQPLPEARVVERKPLRWWHRVHRSLARVFGGE